MFKKTAMILGVICVAALALWAAFTWGLVGDGGYVSIDKSYGFAPESDGDLVIDGEFAEIFVSPGDEFSIRCEAQVAKQRSELVSFDYEQIGSQTVYTLRDKRGAHINIGERATITVSVPQDFKGRLITSGDVGQCKVTGLSLSAIDIANSVGRVEVSQVDAKEIRIQQATGAFYGEGVAADKMDLENETGEVRLMGCDIADLVTNMETGHMAVQESRIDAWKHNGTTGALDAAALSADGGAYEIAVDTGRVSMEFAALSSTISAKTDTGAISLAIPQGMVADAMLSSDIGARDVSVEQADEGLRIEMSSGTGALTLKYVQ